MVATTSTIKFPMSTIKQELVKATKHLNKGTLFSAISYRFPEYRRLINTITKPIFPRSVEFHRHFFVPDNGFYTILVDPKKIQFRTTHYSQLTEFTRAYIVGGDWDIKHKTERGIHPTIKALLIDNIDYQKTKQFESMMFNIDHGIETYGCSNPSQVHDYFKRLLIACQDIKNNGYKSQLELGNPVMDEARGYIARNGEIILGGGGNHRVSIADIYNIKQIPFLIMGVHLEWLKNVVSSTGFSMREALSKKLGDFYSSPKQSHK